MNKLTKIQKSNLLENYRIIVTGCGYKPVNHIFYDFITGEPTHDEICVDNKKMKLNIGSAIAGVLALNGATVNMVSKSNDKLANIKKSIDEITNTPQLVDYSSFDLMNPFEVKNFVSSLPRDKTMYWVQSIGLGAGSYKLKNDNPYLPIDEIPVELLDEESRTVLRGTHLMMQELLPIFKKQKESRIAIVTSMSAIRGYELGGTHCAAKGAIDRYANSAMIGLNKYNIFVTSIRPGIIDTGMYDCEPVINAVKLLGKALGKNYRGMKIPLASPTSLGDAVKYVFTTSAHIPSLNLVAKGQFPQEGS